jgi:hypothetical protein
MVMAKVEEEGKEGGAVCTTIHLSDARTLALTSVWFAATAPTVGHAHKHLIGIDDDLTGSLLLELRHQANPAGVAFAGRVV